MVRSKTKKETPTAMRCGLDHLIINSLKSTWTNLQLELSSLAYYFSLLQHITSGNLFCGCDFFPNHCSYFMTSVSCSNY